MNKRLIFLKVCMMVYSLIFIISNTSASESTLEASTKKDWSASVSTTQYMNFTDQNEPTTSFDLKASTSLGKNSKISISQTLRKLYVVDPDEEELIVEDTKIGHTYKFEEKLMTMKVSLKTTATLPVSEKSERNDHYSTLKGKLGLSKKVMDMSLTISYKPFYSYYAKKYKQTISGSPLNKYKFGHELSLAYAPKNSKWSFSGSVAASQTEKEQSKFQVKESTSDFSYSFSISTAYSINKNISIYAGYVHNNDQLTDGRVETTLFDEEISSSFVGLSASF